MPASINLNLLEKLARSLFEDGEARQVFAAALQAGDLSERAILWLAERPESFPFPVEAAAPWQPGFVDRVSPDSRPGAHPLHEAGAYYCLDLSSVFAATALTACADVVRNEVILDVCSAPGGKAIFAYRLLHPKLLLCNEVIGKRMGALVSNLKRCKITPTMTLRLDTRELAAEFPESFPLVLVDAPCSGQSLLAKGEDSPGCLHPATINMNSNRQKRILANAAQTVAPGGFLAYMTCTYARQENEAVVEWLRKKFEQFVPVEVPLLSAHQSHLADFPCYRLWPQEKLGAGAFVALLRNAASGESRDFDPESIRAAWRSEVN